MQFVTVLLIALFLILPLILFYRQNDLDWKRYVILIPILYVVWYLTYALMHESMHFLAVVLAHKRVIGYQMIPHFWRGEFGTGFVKYNFVGDTADLFIMLAPYLRDILLAIIGYILYRKRIVKTPFLVGLLLVILVFSSLFDIADNYLTYVLGARNDFNAMRVSSGPLVPHVAGILGIAVTMLCSYLVIRDKQPGLGSVNNTE